MDVKLFKKTILSWLVLVFLAIINGYLRNYLYKPILGDLIAHQVSTFIFIIVIFLVTYLFFAKNIKQTTKKELFFIGLIWFILTECFEFLAGHYVFKNSWEKLFTDYNIFKGRLWILVIITTIFSPYIISKLKPKIIK